MGPQWLKQAVAVFGEQCAAELQESPHNLRVQRPAPPQCGPRPAAFPLIADNHPESPPPPGDARPGRSCRYRG